MVSIIVIIGCWIGTINDNIFNIITGFFISLLAWSVTDIYSLFLSVFIQYRNEEREFLRGFYSCLNTYRDAVKKLKSSIDNDDIENILKDNHDKRSKTFWGDVCNSFNELTGYLSTCILKYPCYTLDDKFIRLFRYNWRLFWILSAHLYNNRCDAENLFNRFINVNSHAVHQDLSTAFRELHDDIHSPIKTYDKMKNMPLDDTIFTPSPEVFSMDDLTDIYADTISEFGKGKSEKRTTIIKFVPIDDMMKYLSFDKSITERNCILRLIHSRLYSCIKKGKLMIEI